MINLEYSIARACGLLPEGHEISLTIAKGSVDFELTGNRGMIYIKAIEDIEDDPDLSLAEKLDLICDKAIEIGGRK